jgi:hypothetical protein
MSKLTEAEKQQRAEQRARIRERVHKLAFWDMLLSGLLGVAFLIWLAVYFREGRLQGAVESAWFWVGFAAGVAILAYLVRKFMKSVKVVRNI